jgi:hypothetical protein
MSDQSPKIYESSETVAKPFMLEISDRILETVYSIVNPKRKKNTIEEIRENQLWVEIRRACKDKQILASSIRSCYNTISAEQRKIWDKINT